MRMALRTAALTLALLLVGSMSSGSTTPSLVSTCSAATVTAQEAQAAAAEEEQMFCQVAWFNFCKCNGAWTEHLRSMVGPPEPGGC